MRSLEITLLLLVFSLLSTLIQMTGALPYVNTQAVSQWNSTSTNNMVISQTVSGGDVSGTVGYFTIGMQILSTIGYIILGTCVVAVPICNLFGWSPFIVAAAAAIQTIIYALISFDVLYLWRGISWRSG